MKQLEGDVGKRRVNVIVARHVAGRFQTQRFIVEPEGARLVDTQGEADGVGGKIEFRGCSCEGVMKSCNDTGNFFN